MLIWTFGVSCSRIKLGAMGLQLYSSQLGGNDLLGPVLGFLFCCPRLLATFKHYRCSPVRYNGCYHVSLYYSSQLDIIYPETLYFWRIPRKTKLLVVFFLNYNSCSKILFKPRPVKFFLFIYEQCCVSSWQFRKTLQVPNKESHSFIHSTFVPRGKSWKLRRTWREY